MAPSPHYIFVPIISVPSLYHTLSVASLSLHSTPTSPPPPSQPDAPQPASHAVAIASDPNSTGHTTHSPSFSVCPACSACLTLLGVGTHALWQLRRGAFPSPTAAAPAEEGGKGGRRSRKNRSEKQRADEEGGGEGEGDHDTLSTLVQHTLHTLLLLQGGSTGVLSCGPTAQPAASPSEACTTTPSYPVTAPSLTIQPGSPSPIERRVAAVVRAVASTALGAEGASVLFPTSVAGAHAAMTAPAAAPVRFEDDEAVDAVVLRLLGTAWVQQLH